MCRKVTQEQYPNIEKIRLVETEECENLSWDLIVD